MAPAYIIVWCWYYIWLGNFALVFNSEQRFAREPQDQTAIKGSKVILPCRVINLSGTVQWTKDGFALGNHRNLSEYERYSMIGTDEEGDFSLSIDPISLEDNSRYQCQVSPGKNNESGIRSRTASLTVLIPPEKPEILQGNSLTTTEDREIELECISRDGKPAAELTWIDGLGNVVTNKAEYKKEVAVNKLETARSILKITPKKEHHNTTFKCQAQNTAEKQPQTVELKLEVKYAPKVTVKVIGSGEPGQPLAEGMNVRILCHADANPTDVSYRWSLGERAIFPSNPTEFHLRNITRAEHDSIVKCEVYNTVGKSEDSETLYVTYGPQFRKKPRSVQAQNNTPVTLSCEVDANPLPRISWIYGKTNRIVSDSPNYTMVLTPETSGRYFCKAETTGFPEIIAEATALMKGPPIMKSHSVQYGVVGETVALECYGYAVPETREIFWTFNGQIIATDNPEFAQSVEINQESTKSILTIKDSRQDHFGNFNCSMKNDYGVNSELIVLKSQKSFPILLAFIGVVGGVVVVVAVILILILCRKKVKKLPPPPPAIVIDSEKHCKDSDRSSNISDIKLEIRTGSSASNTNCELDYNGVGQDSDSIITRIATSTLPSHMPLDHRFSINRYSSADYPEPVFPPKTDGHNNNGYVPYVDYARDYNPPPVSLHSLYGSTKSPTLTMTSTNQQQQHTSAMNSLDLRYPTYGSPHLRNSPSLPPLPTTQPPPPPYCTLRNGSVPHVSKFVNAPSSQYIVANTSQQAIIKKGSLATHV